MANIAYFKWLQAAGNVAIAEMFNTFNMGIGFVLIVPADQADTALAQFESAYRIGKVIEGNGVVTGLPEG